MVLVAVFGVALLLFPHQARADGPTEHLRSHVEQVLAVLRDAALRAPEAAGQRRSAVRQVVDGVLDLPAMAERALGRHWGTRTPAERTEFVSVFGALLESLYVAEIERHAEDPIAYLKESLAEGEATVETTIAGKSETRVDYRMHLRNGKWLVYDVLIGGLSVVDNFRSQLNRLLRDSSYAAVVDKLREAAGGQASAASAPR